MEIDVAPTVEKKTFTVRIDIETIDRIRAEAIRRDVSVNRIADALFRAALEYSEKENLLA